MAGGTLKALLVDAYFAPRHERRLFSRQVPLASGAGGPRPACPVVQPHRAWSAGLSLPLWSGAGFLSIHGANARGPRHGSAGIRA